MVEIGIRIRLYNQSEMPPLTAIGLDPRFIMAFRRIIRFLNWFSLILPPVGKCRVRYMSAAFRTKVDRKLKNYFEMGFQNGGSRIACRQPEDTEIMINGRAFLVKSELSGSMKSDAFEYEIAVASVRNR